MTWGADVDMEIPHLGTALYTACVCQKLECARKLLREGQLSAHWIFTFSILLTAMHRNREAEAGLFYVTQYKKQFGREH